jgi:hypothetical protein
VLLTGGWGFVSMIVYNQKIMRSGGVRRYFGTVLLPAVALFAAGAGVLFASVPRLSDSEVVFSRDRAWRHHDLYQLRAEIGSLLDDHPDILQATDHEIAEYLLTALTKGTVNSATQTKTTTGTELRAEDSPGNFTVEKRRDKVVIRMYDHVGMVVLIERSIPVQSGKSAAPGTPGS